MLHTPVMDPSTGDLIGWAISVEWHNRGVTRTKNLRSTISVRRFVPDLPDDFGFASDAKVEPVMILLEANAPMQTGGVFVAITEFEKALAGDGKVYAWGGVTYNDVFDGTPEHRTVFCVVVEPNGPEFKNSKSGNPFGFSVYRKNNTGD